MIISEQKYYLIIKIKNNKLSFFLPKIIIFDPCGYWGPYNLINNTFLPKGIIGITINHLPIISNVKNNCCSNSYLYHPTDLNIYQMFIDTLKIPKSINTVNKLLDFQIKNSIHSPILGFMFDGVPIYGPIGHSNNQIKILKSSYNSQHKYDSNLGDLDMCNGHFGYTPEYPNGIYHYHFTVKIDEDNQNSNYQENTYIPEYPYNIAIFKGIPEVRNFSNDQ